MKRGKGGREGEGGTSYIISTGDIYNFHFVKNEKMLSVSGSNTSNLFNSK